MKEAGLEGEGFTFHSLRHTFASGLCNKREYPKVIQSLLGHSSITQTMDTYSHLMGGMGDEAVDGLDEAFGQHVVVKLSSEGLGTHTRAFSIL